MFNSHGDLPRRRIKNRVKESRLLSQMHDNFHYVRSLRIEAPRWVLATTKTPN